MSAALLWKPTLAATLPAEHDLTALPYPLLASPKLDGVRAMVQRGVLVSRNGRPISNLQARLKFGRKEYEGLDGELTVGPPYGEDVFNRTVRVTQKRDADAGDLRFNVFDWVGAHGLDQVLKVRQAGLDDFFAFATDVRKVHVVKQTLIRNAVKLEAYEATCLRQGYEGIMLRRADAGPYMQKRSTLREFNLVKLKRMEFGEASIVAVYPLRHNDNVEKTATGRRTTAKAGIRLDKTQTGSVLLRDVNTKVEFTVGVPHRTDEVRRWAGWTKHSQWAGKVVRYQFQLCGTLKGGAPRFPTATFKELMP